MVFRLRHMHVMFPTEISAEQLQQASDPQFDRAWHLKLTSTIISSAAVVAFMQIYHVPIE